jgi:transcriptional regulator with XRE-family HTH domain
MCEQDHSWTETGQVVRVKLQALDSCLVDPYGYAAVQIAAYLCRTFPLTATDRRSATWHIPAQPTEGCRTAMTAESPDIMARIRAARAYANLSQPDLAERIGMSLPTYKRAELGRRPVSTEELLTIARACDVPPQFLLNGWTTQRGERRRVAPEDVIGRLDIIDDRLDEWERTATRMFEIVEPVMRARGVTRRRRRGRMTRPRSTTK